MKNNAHTSLLLCLALILPLAPIGAQDSDEVWSDDTWSDKNYTWSDDAGGDVTESAPSEASSEEQPKKAASGEAPRTTVPGETPKTSAPKTSAPKPAPKIQGVNITSLINRVIGYVSKIGAIFGNTTGIRIGGTSVSAIAMLAIAKFIGERAPPWVKWLLYVSGGTMVAGSGANITQMIIQFFS